MKEFGLEQESALEKITEYLRGGKNSIVLNNSFEKNGKGFDLLAGDGIYKSISSWNEKEIMNLIGEASARKQYIFCHFTYSLKDRFEKLVSRHSENFEWPEVFLFIPETLILIKDNRIYIDSVAGNEDEVFNKILPAKAEAAINSHVTVQPSVSKDDYVQTVKKILQHIQQGDIYELNYCFELSGKGAIDPYSTWLKLSQLSPAPFSCFYQLNNNFLICSSPERFIKRINNKIISQPIKGTAARGRTKEEDDLNKDRLLSNEKEFSENVMIVDLVRNDISRIAATGSVTVDELCGLYTFPAVHQLISTVSGEIRKDIAFTDIIKSMFPMGSMTGAPKISAMKIIDHFENFNRGLYSGSVGYISPDGNFDLNVVIRSIIYNDSKQLLSIPVGSAITASSDPESEYQECLLKAGSLLNCIK